MHRLGVEFSFAARAVRGECDSYAMNFATGDFAGVVHNAIVALQPKLADKAAGDATVIDPRQHARTVGFAFQRRPRPTDALVRFVALGLGGGAGDRVG